MTAINIPVAFPGAQQSESAIDALARAVQGLNSNVGALTNTEREQASTLQAVSGQQQNAAQTAIGLGQRFAGVANAAQTLISQLGGQSHAAGLAGAVANTAVQFAQMGAILGPEGAVVGGIVGALIPALRELVTEQDAAAESAARLQEQQERLHEIQQRTAASRADEVRQQLEAGNTATLSLQEIHEQQQLNLDDIAHTRDELAEVQRHFEGVWSTSAIGARDAAVARLNAELLRQVQVTGMLGEAEARRLAQQAEATRDTSGGGTTTTTTTPPAHHGGGGRAHGPSEEEQATERLLALLQQTNETRQLGQTIAEQYHATSEEGAKAEAEAERAYQAELRRTEREQAEADQQRHKSIQQALREEEQTKQKLAQEAQQRTQQGQEATGAIISNLTSVFTLMAEGQANAAQGAELLLAGFLQYISQRATIEALAQVAQGIGSYPDFGGMALHFAAAAAWGAVAVATGVGGAALASDAQGKASAAQSQAAQQPASPQSQDTQASKGNSTVVINWNAPIVTGQTEAQLGRQMRRMVDRATQRWANG